MGVKRGKEGVEKDRWRSREMESGGAQKKDSRGKELRKNGEEGNVEKEMKGKITKVRDGGWMYITRSMLLQRCC